MIKIGDNMARYSLVDLDFKNFNEEEKRYSFMLLDIKMKKLHEENKMVASFSANDIFYEDGEFDFGKVENISPAIVSSKEEAILENIIGLSILAFCAYLKDADGIPYDLSGKLLHPLAISNKFDNFENLFNETDREYYRSVLVGAYTSKELPRVPYYYDYVLEKENSTGKGTSITLIKATEAGRLMADTNQEAAYSNIFLLTIVVACLVLEAIGVVIYYLNK